MAQLVITTGKSKGQTFSLPPDRPIIIGNRRDADVSIRERWISIDHAKVYQLDGAYWIEDLESKFGTFINKDRQTKARLRDQDIISLGETEILFEDRSAVPAEEAAPEAPAGTGEFACPHCDYVGSSARGLTIHMRVHRKADDAPAVDAALDEALEGTAAPAATAAAPGDFDAIIAEKDLRLDEQAVEIAELKELVRKLEERAGAAEVQAHQAQEDVLGRTSAFDAKVGEAEARRAEAKEEVDRLAAERDEAQERAAELVLEVDDLKEKIGILDYRLEQSDAKRGELVREKVREVQERCAKIEEEKAEQDKVIQAYEAKIDQLDERVEELEGENQEMEDLLDETRAKLKEEEAQRDLQTKTLKRKLAEALERTGVLEREGLALKESLAQIDARAKELQARLDAMKELESTLAERDAAVRKARSEAEDERRRAERTREEYEEKLAAAQLVSGGDVDAVAEEWRQKVVEAERAKRAAEATVETLQGERDEAQRVAAGFERELAERTEEAQVREARLSEATAKLAGLQGEAAPPDTKRIALLEAERDELKEQIGRLDKKIERLEKKSRDSMKESIQVETKRGLAEKKTERLDQRVRELEQALAEAEARNQDLVKKNSRLLERFRTEREAARQS